MAGLPGVTSEAQARQKQDCPNQTYCRNYSGDGALRRMHRQLLSHGEQPKLLHMLKGASIVRCQRGVEPYGRRCDPSVLGAQRIGLRPERWPAM